jgi:hypothetical protein
VILGTGPTSPSKNIGTKMNLTCSSLAKSLGLKYDRKIGRQIIFHCPNHNDEHGSLTINVDKNVWMCGPCDRHGGAWDFAFFLSNLTKTPDLLKWLIDKGIIMEEKTKYKSKFIKSYVYKDPTGKEYLQVRKFVDNNGKKSFALYHKDQKGEWISGVPKDTKLYPYKIDEWKDRKIVYIVEGEKDCDELWNWGVPATTNPMGAMSWKEEFNEWFRDKKVVILPDNDEAGKRHAQSVLANIITIASGVKVVSLPGLPPKGDFTDWLSKCNGTKQLFAETVRSTPWATLAEAGICQDQSEEAKILIRRINHDISDLFEQSKPDYDKCWSWMKDHEDLWKKIHDAEDKLNESCVEKDPIEIIQARCIEWKVAFKEAIKEFLKWRSGGSIV